MGYIVLSIISIYPISIAIIIYLFLKTLSRYRKYSNLTEEILSIKLQAYERLVLFLYRTETERILTRTLPLKDENKEDYLLRLLKIIEEEFEHNITQQVYISKKSWRLVIKTKNTIIKTLRNSLSQKDISDAQMLREFLFKNTVQKPIRERKKAFESLRSDISKLFP